MRSFLVTMSRLLTFSLCLSLSLTGIIADISSPCWKLEPVARVLCLVYYTNSSQSGSTTAATVQPTPIAAPVTVAPAIESETLPTPEPTSIPLGPATNETEVELLGNATVADFVPPRSRFAALKFPLRQKFQWKRRDKRAAPNNTSQPSSTADSSTLAVTSSGPNLHELSLMDFHPTTSTSATTATSTATLGVKPTMEGGKKPNCICFACSSAAAGDAEPNENCSKDLHTITEAVRLNIDLIPCVHQCFTNILRIGDYISTFRGCLKPKDLVNSTTLPVNSPYQIKEAGYICTKTPLMGAEWWSCTCDGHFCNHSVPNL